MSLAEDVAAGPSPDAYNAPRRKIDVWLETLDAEDKAALERVLPDFVTWPHYKVQALLRRNGLELSQTQISRYRRDRYGEDR